MGWTDDGGRSGHIHIAICYLIYLQISSVSAILCCISQEKYIFDMVGRRETELTTEPKL